MPCALIAIGGNALLKDPFDGSLSGQYQTIAKTAKKIVNLIKHGIDVIITHGNGPQVGYALYRSNLAQDKVPVLPFDYAVADTQGVIGYMFVNALDNELQKYNLKHKAMCLMTRVLVDKDDSAFLHQDKPVGPYLEDELIAKYKEQYNWNFIQDTHGLRRAVASPSPLEVIEEPTIRKLHKEGFIVICCGGGGVPVIKDENGDYSGVGAVVDKDRTSSLLARQLSCDYLVIPTSVPKVCINFGKENQETLDEINISQAKEYIEQGQFAKGSMLPKIEAILDYITEVDGKGIICSIDDFDNAILHGSGTTFKR